MEENKDELQEGKEPRDNDINRPEDAKSVESVDSIKEPIESRESIESPIATTAEESADVSRFQRNYNPALDAFSAKIESLRAEIGKVIVGQDDLVELMLVALLCGDHVLIEGVPGVAKTLTARMLAKALSVEFSRIQFTPDLMPSDVVGTNIFNLKTSEFEFKSGPVFSNIILIDEINRSPAKTQAALLELMEEQQVTVDGNTYKLDSPFLVLATQNPVEQEGTYKLPEAQLDRFIFKVIVDYPDLEDEKTILKRFRKDFTKKVKEEVKPVMSAKDILEAKALVESIYIRDELLDYIAQIVVKTRNHGDLYLGASPRASISLLKASKAMAALNGRDFVTPDDIRVVTGPVLNHRIIPTPEREMEGVSAEDIIAGIIKNIEVPR